MTELKHLGYDANTKRKYVVVFRQLPEDSTNALVVEPDGLTDRYHDGLMGAVESAESQQTNNLYEVLNRKLFFDGENILQALHTMKKLKKISTADVVLAPSPGQEVSLEHYNKALATTTATATATVTEEVGTVAKPSDSTTTEKAVAGSSGQAKNLIIQAQLLEEDARRKRQEAEEIQPGVNESTKRPRGRPKKDAPAAPLKATETTDA